MRYLRCVNCSVINERTYNITNDVIYEEVELNPDNSNHSLLLILGMIYIIDNVGGKSYVPNNFFEEVSIMDYRNDIILDILK